MNKILLISILISLQFSLFSQYEDWRPIRTDGRYLYDGYRTVRIDSVNEKGDSTHLFGFYEANITDNYCYTPFGTAWFGKEIINTTNKSQIVNRFQDTLLISMQDSQWIFYSSDTLEIKASVIEQKEMVILDQTDSVKVIKLTHSSNANYPDEIIISKNFGLIKTFNFGKFPVIDENVYLDNFFTTNLLGVEKTESGIQPLGTKEIYNLEVGDELHTYAESRDFYGITYSAKKIIRISDVSEINDTIRIGVELCKNEGKTEVEWKIPTTTILDYEPWESQFQDDGNVFYSYMEQTSIGIAKGYSNTWLSKVDENCYDLLHWDKKKSHTTSLVGASGFYLKGLGGPYHNFEGISSASRYELVYYKKGDTTWGTPYNCDSIMGINENTMGAAIAVYPNPVSQQFTVEFQNALPKGYIVVYDETGKALKTEVLMTRKSTINLANGITGPLFYQIIGNNKILKSGVLIKN